MYLFVFKLTNWNIFPQVKEMCVLYKARVQFVTKTHEYCLYFAQNYNKVVVFLALLK